jgi:hypothetical protein
MHITTRGKQSMHDNKLLLERYSAGEIDENESRHIEDHCKTCAQCAGYLGALKGDRQQFLSKHPFYRFWQAAMPVARRPWHAPFLDTLRRPSFFPAYGAIIILFMLAPIIYFKGIQGPGITFKGGSPAISFLLKRNGLVSACTPLDTLFPGDEIQVLFSLVKKGHISLVSVDSHGALSWYHPDYANSFCSVPAKPGNNRNFPSGILLDDSKGRELVIALFSKAPLKKASVKQWVNGGLKKTNADLSALQRELDSTGNSINALPLTALFQKGN